MNLEIRKAWIEALRSGKYKQGRYALKTTKNEYCCLGVLWEVCGFKEWQPARGGLPGVLEPIYDAEKDGGYVPSKAELGCSSDFMYMNDDQRKSFAEIADEIEKQF